MPYNQTDSISESSKVNQWKYITPVQDPNIISSFSGKNKVHLPDGVVKFILTHNAGRPIKNRFDTNRVKGNQFDGLFSYNRGDTDNIFNIYTGKFKRELQQRNLYPLGMTPNGDVICIKLNSIVLFRNETHTIETISDSFNGFINKLY